MMIADCAGIASYVCPIVIVLEWVGIGQSSWHERQSQPMRLLTLVLEVGTKHVTGLIRIAKWYLVAGTATMDSDEHLST